MNRIALFIFIVLLSSCGINRQEQAHNLVEEVRKQYASDKRTAIFEIEVEHGSSLVLKGETNLAEAKAALIASLNEADIESIDKINMLPDVRLGEKTFGIINISVANLRSRPAYSAELVTQALLGTPVYILKRDGGWYMVQTPDRYIAWMTSSSLVPIAKQEMKEWKNSEKLIYLSTYGHAMDTTSNRISDLVAGDVLVSVGETENHWKVIYPNGREALVAKSEAMKLPNWIRNITVSDSSIVQMAKSLMGVPYLWGGTSAKGVDCSGFTKTVYLMHGMVLPRDASQQVFAGQLVDSIGDFSKLQVGDLLFFGKKNDDRSERVIHVGLWIGDNQFIHSSGDVHISSMDSLSQIYDRYNFDRYLRSKRIIGVEDPIIKRLADIY